VTRSATTGRPEWLASRAVLASRFPKLAQRAGPGELACAVLPLRADGVSVGILGVKFARRRDFTDAEQDFLLELASICARHLRRWTEPAPAGPRPPSATQLGQLVQALSQTESADEVAQVVAGKGAAAGAQFANIAVMDPAADTPARLYHAPSMRRDIADRYSAIPLDESTPLGAVLQSGGEVWHPSLTDIAGRYPELLEDLIAARAAATASLALTDRQQHVIGALGLAWGQAQAFTEVQKNEIRVVARLAADALSRAQQLEAERAARQRTERLQRMMTALVASASLDEVKASVFQHGLLPFGASAARLVLADQQQSGRLMTVNAVGLPEPALTEWREFPLSAHSPSRKALATGTIVYMPSRADLEREFPAAHLSFAGPTQRAWAAVPLRSGGRNLGVFTLIFSRPHPLDEGRDQLALTALGSAISDAISRAAQHDSDRDLVVSVQRSLLAGALPERPGLQLGAQYLPAEARYGIGGDWYDAIPLADGRMMLIVGDVAGHGLEAAIGMGQVRSAARALAPAYQPAALLEALDQFICSTIREPLATAAVAIIDPASRTVRYCLAGHPPPLLRAPDGSVRTLDGASGILLGLETRDRPERVVRFVPGSSLVLFTDGLIERRDVGVDAGIAWLADELKKELPPDPAELCDTLVRQSVARNGRDDDTAVLCAYLSLGRPLSVLRPPFRRPGPIALTSSGLEVAGSVVVGSADRQRRDGGQDMRAAMVSRFGGPEVFELAELPDPRPGPGQVVIAVEAADTLFLETVVRSGAGQDYWPMRPPYVPGNGVAGRVIQAGDGVAASLPGQRVAAHTGGEGGYADRAVIPAADLSAIPDSLDVPVAAALLHDGATALALFDATRVSAADTVLVLGASGGLGVLSLQLARARAARVVAIARGAKLDRIREQRPDAVIDSGQPDWIDQARAVLPAAGADVVLDNIGGALGEASFALTADGGRFSGHGTPAGRFAQVDPAAARRRGITATGIEAVQLSGDQLRRYTSQALDEAAAGRLTPVIGQVFGLDQAGAAHAAIESRAVFGKTLLAAR
jgi:NADPH:quinone reductase-like Zn-dependent oxidoreductase/GAF domain-containing protein